MANPRLIVANLDFEERLSPGPGRLPASAERKAAALGSLLRAFAEPGDRLWLPAPVSAERLPDVPGLAAPEIVVGPVEPLAGEETRFWGDPAAARVNHRGFGLEVARRLGLELPGSALVESADDLEQRIADHGDEAWVVKAAYSATGRSRLFGDGPGLGDRRAAERFFARHGAGVLEPWLDRTEDFGAVGTVGESGISIEGVHRQVLSDRGHFRGILLAPVDEADRLPIEDAARGVGVMLREEGFRGPFGTDAFRHRGRDGRTALHPLSELNARMTFGHVARRVAPEGPDPIALRTGNGPPPEGTVALLLPGRVDSTSAWLEMGPQAGILRETEE